MRLSAKPHATAILMLLCVSCVIVSIAAAASRVHGVVSDASGGVLPGVTVVATNDDGQVVASAVTDGVGEYSLTALSAGPLTITYELDGFAPAVAGFTLYDLSVDVVVNRRLALATRSEMVTVYGNAPVETVSDVPTSTEPSLGSAAQPDRDAICGPAKLTAAAESLGTIRARRNAPEYELYAQGDELLIDGGAINGLAVGRYLAVRRSYRSSDRRRTTNAEHTAGLIQIVAAEERSSTAVVVFACDELRRGDRVTSFKPEPTRTPESRGTPDYANAAQILFSDLGQMVGVPWRLMVIDRGRDGGMAVGQRLTLFRRHAGAKDDVAVVGRAVVVAVRADSATIRVDQSTDAIAAGDWAAPERHSSGPSVPDSSSNHRRP